MFSFWKRNRRVPAAVRPPRLRVDSLDVRALPSTTLYATGAGPGGDPHVIVRNQADQIVASFYAYDLGFRGGVNVAMGDVNGDGVDDLVTGAGAGGGPHVKVYDGTALLSGQAVELRSFMAYDPRFGGGVNVAVGDIDGDHKADIITGAGPGGGPHVKGFSGADNSILTSFYAYDPNFRGGVSVAADDLGGDNGGTAGGVGNAEILTGAGPGGGPHVKVFDYNTLKFFNDEPLASFMAFDPNFTGGVTVATGFVTNNRDSDNFLYSDIIVGAGPGGAPAVNVYRLLDAFDNPDGSTTFSYNLATTFLAFDARVPFGMHVASQRRSDSVLDDIVVGAGKGGGPEVKVFAGQAIGDLQSFVPTLVSDYLNFDPIFAGGVNVGGGQQLNRGPL